MGRNRKKFGNKNKVRRAMKRQQKKRRRKRKDRKY